MILSRLASRLTAFAFGAMLLTSVWAQNLGSTWGDYSGKDWSSYGSGAFVPGDRTLFVRWEGVNTLVCKDGSGITLWEYSLGTSIGIDSILVTTDGYIYLSGYDAPSQQDGKGIILALRFDGTLAWRYDFNKRSDINESLGQMRIFGSSIVVCGSGKPTTSGPEPHSIVIASVDRFTGAENYVQGFTPGGISMGYRDLRSAGGFAYLLATGPYPTYGSAVLKLDPATGNLVGSFVDLSSEIRDIEVDSAGGIYAGGNSLRRINGSGSGTFPVVYTRPIFCNSMTLFGGALYILSGDVIRKVNLSDGITIWQNTHYADVLYAGTPNDLEVDTYGRLFVTASDFWWSGWAGEYYLSTSWWIQSVDSKTGAFLNKYQMGGSSDEPDPFPSASGSISLGPYGEILRLGVFVGPPTDPNAWGNAQFGEAYRYYQQPEPVADTYSCVEGSTFSTNLSGVLLNDKYVNPAQSKAILVTPPVHGTLTMTDDGEFIYNSAGAPIGAETFTYRVTRGTLSATAQANIVISRGLASLALARTTLAGQNATLGTVTLSSAGASATIALSDDSSLVSVPASVLVAVNKTSANFGVSVLPVSVPVATHVSATYAGITKTVTLNLTPLIPTAISLTPSTVVGGNTVSVRVVINGVAGTGGKVLAVSDNSTYCTVPPTVTVPAGASSVTLNATTTHPATQQIVKITAAVTAGRATATLRINP